MAHDPGTSSEPHLRPKSARERIAELEAVVDRLQDDIAGGRAARQVIEKLRSDLRQSLAAMEQQADVARRFQNLFNPPALPHLDGVTFCVNYQPCSRVGGDLYDVFDMGNGCVGIFVADIAGCGLAAVIVTALTKMAFDTFRQNEYSPRKIMEKLNAYMTRHTLSNQFFTAFFGVLDLETLRMKFVNAAHPAPVVFNGDRFELLDAEGLCCGMFEDPQYQEKEVALVPGERIVVVTRGILDMCGADGRRYEDVRLHGVLKSHRGAPLADLMRALAADFDRHLAGAEHTEDLTLVGVELTPREVVANRIVIHSEPQQIGRIESRIIERLEKFNYGERAIFGVRLAVEEAVVNAIKHGNKMDKAKKVVVTYSVDDKACTITVEDEGEGFDPDAVPDPTCEENLELSHGRGLCLMRAYMDEVSYNESGTCVTLIKKAPWAD